MADNRLQLFSVPAVFLDGTTMEVRAEGNNAAWHCPCGAPLPLLGRCYYQFGQDCHTVCPHCGRTYRVHKDPATKRTKSVEEVPPL